MAKTPPLIILMDIMVVIIFGLLLKPEPADFKTVLPSTLGTHHTAIIAFNQSNKEKVFIDGSWKDWIDFYLDTDQKLLEHNTYFETYREVYQTLPIIDKSKNFTYKTLIFGDTYSNIVHKIFVDCYQNTNEECKGDIDIIIDKDGSVKLDKK
jgi:hypothetical protein